MTVDLQVVVDVISNIFIISFPFALIFWIVGKITNFFMSFVLGKEVRF